MIGHVYIGSTIVPGIIHQAAAAQLGIINDDPAYGTLGCLPVCPGFTVDIHIACVSVADPVKGISFMQEDIPEGMLSWQILESKYAVAACSLPTLHETFHELYHEWLPNSGYERAPGPEFELYDERFDNKDPHSELDLYIPIR